MCCLAYRWTNILVHETTGLFRRVKRAVSSLSQNFSEQLFPDNSQRGGCQKKIPTTSKVRNKRTPPPPFSIFVGSAQNFLKKNLDVCLTIPTSPTSSSMHWKNLQNNGMWFQLPTSTASCRLNWLPSFHPGWWTDPHRIPIGSIGSSLGHPHCDRAPSSGPPFCKKKNMEKKGGKCICVYTFIYIYVFPTYKCVLCLCGNVNIYIYRCVCIIHILATQAFFIRFACFKWKYFSRFCQELCATWYKKETKKKNFDLCFWQLKG